MASQPNAIASIHGSWSGSPRRTRHVRFNDLSDPEPVPMGTDFSSVIESDVPIVVQHLDSRQAENALLSTIAFPGDV